MWIGCTQLPFAVAQRPFVALPRFSSGMIPCGQKLSVLPARIRVMTAAVEDRAQARIDGSLQVLRDAEADVRRSYARVLDVVAELDAQRAGAVAGFGTTARLLAGVLNLSTSEAKARAEHAELLTPRHSLTGEILPPKLPTTAVELAAGAIGPAHLRVITTTMRRIPPSTHPDVAAQAEQTLATAARRFDPAALTRIGERLLAHLDPDGKKPAEEPEQVRELRVGTGSDGTVSLAGKLDPKAAPGYWKSSTLSMAATPPPTVLLTCARRLAAMPMRWWRR
ncbi:MAG: DUF222 domain-containing protein [Pseudonocardiaceae bacterium]